jgi:hypothetical protein
MVSQDQLTLLKFPIGPFNVQENISETELEAFINTIAAAPAKYRKLTEGLKSSDLRKSYREGAWNIQQIVNHVADMQLLHYFRMKKALTETDYKEITLVNIDGWAATPDALNFSIAESLDMFESITNRFVFLMRSLNEQQYEIAYYHPVRKVMLNQKQAISMSAWHVEHHFAHIRTALAN